MANSYLAESSPGPVPVVLIVEDEQQLLELLAVEIAGCGYRVLTAADGQDGLAKARQGGIDAIVTDIHMPNLSGMDMLETLRHEQIETPIVFLTAWATREYLARALRMGAFDFLQKPSEPEHLLKVVKMAVAYGLLLRRLDEDVAASLPTFGLSATDLVELRAKKRSIALARIQRLALTAKGA